MNTNETQLQDGIAESLPEQLRERPQWVNWRTTTRNGKSTKIPLRPDGSGRNARANDMVTWGAFDDALEQARLNDELGLGFVFSEADSYVGIDLDNCLTERGGPVEWLPALDSFIGRAYIERSPSGTGLHLIVPDASVPDWWTNKARDVEGESHEGVEVYDSGRFFTVTGDTLDISTLEIEPLSDGEFEDWLRLAAVEFGDDTDTADASDVQRTSPSRKTDVDLTVYDVVSQTSYPEGTRNEHPFHGSDTGTNFRVDEGGETWRCERHSVTGNAAHLLGIEQGIISCGAWHPSGLDAQTWRDVFDAAREDGYDIPIPKSAEPDRSHVPGHSPSEADESEPDERPPRDIIVPTDLPDESAEFDGEASPWTRVVDAYIDSETSQKSARHLAVTRLRNEFHFATFRDTDELYVYDPSKGIYRNGGETVVRGRLEVCLGGENTAGEASEILHRIKAGSYRDRDEFGADESDPKVCLENGVLGLPDGEFRDHSPGDLFLTYAPVTYDPDADCENFDSFLGDVLETADDKALAYEMLGYSLYPGYPFAKSLFVYGDGANGKSTLLDVFEAVLGVDNVASRGLVELEENRFAASDLYGSYANICGDLPDEALTRTGTFKKLTGGDLVTGDKKHQQPFSFRNRAKLIFSANDPPQISDDSTAMYRRLLLLNFPNEFTPPGQPGPDARPKHELLGELTADDELSGVLNRALAALADVFDRGAFSQTEDIDQVRERYKRVSDPIYAFAAECLREDVDGEIEKDQLYAVYRQWSRDAGAPVKAKNVFSRELAKHVGIEGARVRRNGRRKNVYQGAELSPRGQQHRPGADGGGDNAQGRL